MQLNNIGMVAGDTSRSRAYLQALIRNNLFPCYVLVLENTSGKVFPGESDKSKVNLEREKIIESDECWSEAHFDSSWQIKDILNESGIHYEVIEEKDINHPSVVEALCQRDEDVFIYSGFGGTLLKSEVLSIGKKFLHVHGGYLPDFKGSTSNYYSLIVENTFGASAIFMTEAIDGGPVLLRRKFPSPENRRVIDYIYDSGARAKVLVETLQNYLKCGSWEIELPENSGGETYYIIHPVLKHIAILDNGDGV